MKDRKYFVALTASNEFWDKNKNIIFLGEWCYQFSKINLNAYFKNQETLNYIWDDNKKKFNDYKYLKKLSNNILKQLTPQLNEIHNSDLDERGWTIIAGQWIEWFCSIVFHRYFTIKNLISYEEDIYTFISDKDLSYIIPEDNNQFYYLHYDHDYNFLLLSDIVRHLNALEYKTIEFNQKFPAKPPSTVLRKKILTLFNLFAKKNQHTMLYSTGLPLFQELKLILKMKQGFSKKYLYDLYSIPKTPVNLLIREKISLKSSNNFESYISKVLPLQIPKAFLENFSELKKQGSESFGTKTKTIFSTTTHFNDEIFKNWVAHMTNKGCNLIINQHGGNYGIAKYSSLFDHELRICDKFVSWGWTKNEKVYPLFGNRLLKIPQKKIKRKKNRILYILSSTPMYPDRLYSIPSGPKWKNYISDQKYIYKNLNQELRDQIEIKEFPINYGWEEKLQFEEAFGKVKFVSHNKKLEKIRYNYDLIIETCNQTTFLESLTSGIPTIIYFNTEDWEIHDNSKHLIKELKLNNIFFDDPVALISHLNNLDDIISWWMSKEIQNSVSKFCKVYANRSENWKINLIELLKN